MNLLSFILGILGITAAAGGLSAYYKRGEGKETVELLKTQVQVFKDNEEVHLRQIAELKAIVDSRDKTIVEQRSTIKTMVKEFKEYKNE